MDTAALQARIAELRAKLPQAPKPYVPPAEATPKANLVLFWTLYFARKDLLWIDYFKDAKRLMQTFRLVGCSFPAAESHGGILICGSCGEELGTCKDGMDRIVNGCTFCNGFANCEYEIQQLSHFHGSPLSVRNNFVWAYIEALKIMNRMNEHARKLS